MRVQIQLGTGGRTRTFTYRFYYNRKKVYAELIENFYKHQDSESWGELLELKGKNIRILRHFFGQKRLDEIST